MGAGKTLSVVRDAWVLSRSGTTREVFTNFPCSFARKLVVGEAWPDVRGAIIILDELLFLDGLGLVPKDWITTALPFVRKRRQQVFLISQGHRLPLDKKAQNTVTRFTFMRALFPAALADVLAPIIGHWYVERSSSEPFVRQWGIRSPGLSVRLRVVPKRFLAMYDTSDVRCIGLDGLEASFRRKPLEDFVFYDASDLDIDVDTPPVVGNSV